MADYRVTAWSGHQAHGVAEIVADTYDDVLNIPVSSFEPGTLVYCIETSTYYVLGVDLTWSEKPAAGGGGGGTSDVTKSWVVEKLQSTVDGLKDELVINKIELNDNNHTIITYQNGSTADVGELSMPEATLTTALKATTSIGSVTSGKTYNVGTSLETIIRDILISYKAPSITLSTTPATKLYDIVEDSISTILLKAVVTKNTKNVTKVAFFADDATLNQITTGVASGGTFQYQYTPATPITSDVVFKATVTDGTQQTQSSITIKFVGKSYYGICDASVSDPTETVIKSGANTLKDTKTYTYTGITTNWGKVFYAYPKSFGALTYIKDEVNNINYFDSFQRSEVSVDGIDYYCYTLTEPTAAENNQITFK